MNINKSNIIVENDLIRACKHNTKVVRILITIQKAHPEYQDKDGNSALMIACEKNNMDMVKLLLATNSAQRR